MVIITKSHKSQILIPFGLEKVKWDYLTCLYYFFYKMQSTPFLGINQYLIEIFTLKLKIKDDLGY